MALSQTRADKIKKPGRYGDGRNVYLQVMEGGSRSWIFRDELRGRERVMGQVSALALTSRWKKRASVPGWHGNYLRTASTRSRKPMKPARRSHAQPQRASRSRKRRTLIINSMRPSGRMIATKNYCSHGSTNMLAFPHAGHCRTRRT